MTRGIRVLWEDNQLARLVTRSAYPMGTLVRYLRYALYLGLIGMIGWTLSSFAFIRLEEGDASVLGVSGLRRVMVERLDSETFAARRGEVLVFAILNREDQQIFRISRVAAIPGDTLEHRQGTIHVNGENTGLAVRYARPPEGTIPSGFLVLFNDNRLSEFADSLSLGLVDQRAVIGRFLTEMPF